MMSCPSARRPGNNAGHHLRSGSDRTSAYKTPDQATRLTAKREIGHMAAREKPMHNRWRQTDPRSGHHRRSDTAARFTKTQLLHWGMLIDGRRLVAARLADRPWAPDVRLGVPGGGGLPVGWSACATAPGARNRSFAALTSGRQRCFPDCAGGVPPGKHLARPGPPGVPGLRGLDFHPVSRQNSRPSGSAMTMTLASAWL